MCVRGAFIAITVFFTNIYLFNVKHFEVFCKRKSALYIKLNLNIILIAVGKLPFINFSLSFTSQNTKNIFFLKVLAR